MKKMKNLDIVLNMPTFKASFFLAVNIKWGKEKFENVEVDMSEPPEVFKAQLFALSGVPPERQKIMAKGTTLKVLYLSLIS